MWELPFITERSVAMDFAFVACKRSATLLKYNGQSNRVVIPSHFEGKPVTEIGPGAFASKYNINAVVLPETLKRIEVNAFGWARKLAYIGTVLPTSSEVPTESVLPASVRYIGAHAFTWNFSTKKLTILGNKVEIGEYAFASSNIEEVYLPNCTELYLSHGVFVDCTKLKRVVAPMADAGMISSCCFEGCLELQQMDVRFASLGCSAFYGCRE